MRREIKTEAFLARLPLFAGLAAPQLARLAAATTRRRLARGEALFDELERSPQLARRVIASLARRVEALVREVETYALGSAAKRFVAWLLRRLPEGALGEATLALPGTKSALASQLNLSAEHFSRILRELAARGLIEVRGRRLRVPDLERLRAWSAIG